MISKKEMIIDGKSVVSLTSKETDNFFHSRVTDVFKVSDILDIVEKGKNFLIDGCFLVGYIHFDLEIVFNMVYTVETRESYEIYARTKVKVLREMIKREKLETTTIISYTDKENEKAMKFNKQIFRYMVEDFPVENSLKNIFTNDKIMYNYLMSVKNNKLG